MVGQERSGDVEVARAEQVPAGIQGIGERLQRVLPVDEERWQVVREVVAERDGHDRDNEPPQRHRGGGPGPSRAGRGGDRVGREQRRRGADQAEGVARDERGTPRVLQRILAHEIEPPESAREPVERDRGQRHHDEDDSRRRKRVDPKEPRSGHRYRESARSALLHRAQRRNPAHDPEEPREDLDVPLPRFVPEQHHADHREDRVSGDGEGQNRGVLRGGMDELEPGEEQQHGHGRPGTERLRPVQHARVVTTGSVQDSAQQTREGRPRIDDRPKVAEHRVGEGEPDPHQGPDGKRERIRERVAAPREARRDEHHEHRRRRDVAPEVVPGHREQRPSRALERPAQRGGPNPDHDEEGHRHRDRAPGLEEPRRQQQDEAAFPRVREGGGGGNGGERSEPGCGGEPLQPRRRHRTRVPRFLPRAGNDASHSNLHAEE